MRIVLLGPPAAGKGTQGRKLAARFSLPYLSTGALLRQAIAEGSPLGLQAEPILARGGYLPDQLILPVLSAWLERPENQKGWVLDGFPRTLVQAQSLDAVLMQSSGDIDCAIALNASFEFLVKRVHDRVESKTCGWTGTLSETLPSGNCPECGDSVAERTDDHDENVLSRYHEFVKNTLPAIDFYKKAGKLISIDATQSREDVSAAILRGFPQTVI